MTTKLLNEGVIYEIKKINFSKNYKEEREEVYCGGTTKCSDGSCKGDCVGSCWGDAAR